MLFKFSKALTHFQQYRYKIVSGFEMPVTKPTKYYYNVRWNETHVGVFGSTKCVRDKTFSNDCDIFRKNISK